MGAFGVSLLLGLGGAAWIYSKFYSRTGGNTSAALTTAAFSGVAIIIVSFLILKLIGL